jgi:hypothetical protein
LCGANSLMKLISATLKIGFHLRRSGNQPVSFSENAIAPGRSIANPSFRARTNTSLPN